MVSVKLNSLTTAETGFLTFHELLDIAGLLQGYLLCLENTKIFYETLSLALVSTNRAAPESGVVPAEYGIPGLYRSYHSTDLIETRVTLTAYNLGEEHREKVR